MSPQGHIRCDDLEGQEEYDEEEEMWADPVASAAAADDPASTLFFVTTFLAETWFINYGNAQVLAGASRRTFRGTLKWMKIRVRELEYARSLVLHIRKRKTCAQLIRTPEKNTIYVTNVWCRHVMCSTTLWGGDCVLQICWQSCQHWWAQRYMSILWDLPER